MSELVLEAINKGLPEELNDYQRKMIRETPQEPRHYPYSRDRHGGEAAPSEDRLQNPARPR